MTKYAAYARLIDGLEDAGMRDCTAELGGYYSAETEIFATLDFEQGKSNLVLTKGYDKNSRAVSFEGVDTKESVDEVLSFLV